MQSAKEMEDSAQHRVPDPIRLLVVANDPTLRGDDDELRGAASVVDLVVSLGGVDLFQVAQALPHGKPALCVLGPEDERQVPPQFRLLHRSGFNFRGWDLAGLSGGQRIARGPGLYLSDDDSEALLGNFPQCSIFFTHAYPQGLVDSGTEPRFGMQALDDYLRSRPPIYHFYAHPHATTVEAYGHDGQTLSIGVNGLFQPPTALEFV